MGLSAGLTTGWSIASGVQFAQIPSDTWFGNVYFDSKTYGNVSVASTDFTVNPSVSYRRGVEVFAYSSVATYNTLMGLERLNLTAVQNRFDFQAFFSFDNPAQSVATLDFNAELRFRNSDSFLGGDFTAVITGVTSSPDVQVNTNADVYLSNNPTVAVSLVADFDSTTSLLNFVGSVVGVWNPVSWISVASATATFQVDTSNANHDNLGATLNTFYFKGIVSFPFDGTSGQGATAFTLTAADNFKDWNLKALVDLSKTAAPQLVTVLNSIYGASALGDNLLSDFSLSSTTVISLVVTTANLPTGERRGLTLTTNVNVAGGSFSQKLFSPIGANSAASLAFALYLYGPIFDNLQVSSIEASLSADLVQVSPTVAYADVDVSFSVGKTTNVNADLVLNLNLANNAQPVSFKVSTTWSANDAVVTFAGGLNTPWNNPFGFKWLEVNALSVSFVVTTGATSVLQSLNFDGKVALSFASSSTANSYDWHLTAANNFADVTSKLTVTVDSLTAVVNAIGQRTASSASTDDLAFKSSNIVLVITTANYVDPTSGRTYLAGLTLEFDAITVVKSSTLYNRLSALYSNPDTVTFTFSMFLPVFGDMSKGLVFNLASTAIPIKSNLKFEGFSVSIGIDVPATVSVTTGLSALFAKQPDWLTFDVGGVFNTAGEVSLQGSMSGVWTNVLGLKGFDIANAWISVGFGPAGIESFGVGGKITVGGIVIDINGYVDIANPTNVFFISNVANLSLRDLALAFNGAQQDSTNPPIDVTTIPNVINIQSATFAIAPLTGNFMVNNIVIHFDEGLAVNGTATFLGLDHMSIALTTSWDPLHPDFSFGISLSFANLTTAFNMFMDSILPPHVLRPDGPVSNWAQFISDLSYIIPQLTSLEISDFSLAKLSHGVFPSLSMNIQVYNKPHPLTLQLSLAQLIVKFGDLLTQGVINLRKLINLPECIIDADCAAGTRCSHMKGSAWQCVSKIPAGAGVVPLFGPVSCVSSADCSGSPSGGCCKNNVCVKDNIGTNYCGYCTFGSVCNDPASGCIFGICTGCITSLDCLWSGSAGHICSNGVCHS